MMSVRLQRDISSSATRSRSGLFERERFSVLETFVKIGACACDFAATVNYHAADEGAGANLPDA
jgi:hypothetical protein